MQRPSSELTIFERLYLTAVGLSALWIGAWGYFLPARQKAIPFAIPPLHARFLGAMYLSAVTLLLGGLLSKNWRGAAIVPLMTVAWTGGITLVSMLHTELFDFSTPQTWIWFVAYWLYAAIALLLLWIHRAELRPAGRGGPPGWIRRYLIVQGLGLTILAAALLLFPATMTKVWPWPITVALAQLYFAPFLAYGVGSLAMSRMSDLRVGVATMTVFATGVLSASLIHRNLFSLRQAPDLVWFAGFTVATLVLASIWKRAFVDDR